MGDIDGIAKLAIMGMVAIVFILGAGTGFFIASVINLGKLCL
jgi:hypothetical protein